MVMEKEKRAREKREEREEVGRRQGAGRVTAKQAITRLVGRRMLIKVKADEKRVGESAVLGGEEWGGEAVKTRAPPRRCAGSPKAACHRFVLPLGSNRAEFTDARGSPPPPPLLFTRIEIAFSNLRNSSPRNFYDLLFSLSLLLPFFGSQLPERSHSRLDQREREKFFSPCNVKYRFQQRNYGS